MTRTTVPPERIASVRGILEQMEKTQRTWALKLLAPEELPAIRYACRDLLERAALDLVRSTWPALNKNNTLAEYERELKVHAHQSDALITEVVQLDTAEWLDFTHSLLANRDWLAGKGGNGSTAELRDVDEFWQFTEEERAEYKRHAYTLAIEVRSHGKRILVDPQGYNYARYVGFFL